MRFIEKFYKEKREIFTQEEKSLAGKSRKKSGFHGKIKSETTGIEAINNDTTKIKQEKTKNKASSKEKFSRREKYRVIPHKF